MVIIMRTDYLRVIDQEDRDQKNYCKTDYNKYPFWVEHNQQWDQQDQQMEQYCEQPWENVQLIPGLKYS